MNAKKENPMRKIRIQKITLNVGAGKDKNRLEKSMKLLKIITGINPKKTATQKRIPGWGLRPGLTIGCKVTVRGKKCNELLKRFVEAKDYLLSENMFDKTGNLSFGFKEYIDIEGVKYDPEIGVLGFNVAVTLERPGYKVKLRFYKKSKIGKAHLINQEDAIEFIKENFKVKLEEEE